MTILECPTCFSHRATVLDCRPPKARCADCGTVYEIKTEKPIDSAAYDEDEPQPKRKRKHNQDPPPVAPDLTARQIGLLTDAINQALKAGPDGYRDAQRKANALARKFGITYLEPQWFTVTAWLLQWASGEIPSDSHPKTAGGGRYVPKNPLPLPPSDNQRRPSASRLRVRMAIRWRSRVLCNMAMSGSYAIACRAAKVSEHTFRYHRNNDPEFARMIEDAKAHCIDLLHARCMQRSLEGDIEPIYWQGIKVDHVRKFSDRLQIEMLRAHMPDTFKTPVTGQQLSVQGDVLVLTEEARAKLIAANRERIMALPENYIEGEFTKVGEPPAAPCRIPRESNITNDSEL